MKKQEILKRIENAEKELEQAKVQLDQMCKEPALPTFEDCFNGNGWWHGFGGGKVVVQSDLFKSDSYCFQRTEAQARKVITFAKLQAVADYLNDRWEWERGYQYYFIYNEPNGNLKPSEYGEGYGHWVLIKFKSNKAVEQAIEIFRNEGEYENLVELFT